MKKNMGIIDRAIRTGAAVVIVALMLAGQLDNSLAIILSILAIVFLATSVVSFCPLYWLFNLSTGRKPVSKMQ